MLMPGRNTSSDQCCDDVIAAPGCYGHYCEPKKRIPSRWVVFFLNTPPCCTFSSRVLSLHSHFHTCLQNHLLFFPRQRIEKQRENGSRQKAESHDNLIRCVLSCPFWAVPGLLAGCSFTRSEWIDICVDVCPLNAKIWRGRGWVGGGIKRRPMWWTVSISSWTLNSSPRLQ